MKNIKDMYIPPVAMSIMDVLWTNDMPAYIVGGANRDFFMGIEPHDYDIVCAATPDEIERVVKSYGFRSVPSGVDYGVQMVIGDDGIAYEVAAMRKDTNQSTSGNRSECDVVMAQI